MTGRPLPQNGGVEAVSGRLCGQWYFLCPRCDRPVRQLHIPPGEQTFGYQHCYDLTYRTSNGNCTLDGRFEIDDHRSYHL